MAKRRWYLWMDHKPKGILLLICVFKCEYQGSVDSNVGAPCISRNNNWREKEIEREVR